MAMVPKYTSRASVPGSTGMQPVSLSLATSPLEGAGQGITQVAGQLEAAAGRIQSREDVINSQRAMELFRRNEDLEYQKFEKESDLLNTSSVEAYQEGLKKRIENATTAFPLSANALAQNQANIRAAGSIYFRDMLRTSLAAQENYTFNGVRTALESNLLPFDSDPKMDESKIKQQKAIVLQTVAERSVNLSSLKEQELIKEGNARVYNNAFNSYFASGNIAEAKKLINSEDYRLSVDDAQYRTSAKTLLDQEKSDRAGYDAGIRKLQEQSAILGRPISSFTQAERDSFSSLGAASLKLTPEEKAAEWTVKNKGVAPPPELVDTWITGEETPASRIIQTNAIRKSLGQPPLNDQEMARFNQIEKAAGKTTENERRMNYLVENAPLFGNGQLSDEATRRWVALAQEEYNSGISIGRNANDQIVTFAKGLPASIQAALDKAQITLTDPVNVTPQAQDFGLKLPDVPENETVFGQFTEAVGVVPGIRSLAVQIPFIGEGVSGESLKAQTSIRNANRALVTAMQNSPRFAEAERSTIESELGLDPRLFTTTKAYFAKLVAVQKTINRMIQEDYSVLSSPTVSKKIKERTRASLIALTSYDKVLGMPEIIDGPNDPKLQGLDAGDKFVYSATGQVFTKN